MEMQHAKASAKIVLLIELVIIVAIGIAALVSYYLFGAELQQVLSDKTVEIIYRQFNIAFLIGIFVLFNTTYYSYVTYHSKRMFVLTTTCAIIALSYVYFFTASFMRIGLYSRFIPHDAQLQVTVMSLILVIGVSISHFYEENDLIPFNHEWQKSLPFGLGLLGAVLCVAINLLLAYFLSADVTKLLIAIIQIGELIGISGMFIFELKRFIVEQNRYQIRMASSIGFLLFTVVSGLIPAPNFALGNAIYNFFLVVACLSYIHVAFKYNIAMPVMQQKNAERQIKLYAENLEVIVNKRTAELRKGNEQFVSDIEYARKIQQSLLPGEFVSYEGVEFVSLYYPCERLSGDFYDIYMIDDDHIGMYVLDVSGHGVPAALMTMFCMNYIKSSERLINQFRAKKPHRNLKHFFEEFNKVNFPDEMHMVMFFATYDMRARVLTYCSGGMNTLPFVIRTDGQTQKLDQSIGFPICRVGSFFTPEFHSAKIDLTIGDRVIFYTDGLTDKSKNFIFDEEELLSALCRGKDLSLKELKETLVGSLSTVFNRLDDDLTFFIMEVK